MAGVMRAGLVTFDFPPQYRRADLAGRSPALGGALAARLSDGGVQVVTPCADLARRDPSAAGGIRDARDLQYCLEALRSARVDCLVIEVCHWMKISFVAQLVHELGLPTAVFAVVEDGWNGVPGASAVCGSIRELPRTRNESLLEAFLGPGIEGLLSWIKGVTALARMRRSSLMLWGGGYGAEMPYSRGDPAAVESLLVGEVMTEQEEVLTRRAGKIQIGEHGRIVAFLSWLVDHGVEIERDGRMVTQESLDFQTALYLSARDRLEELESGSPPDGRTIIGASIKCHYEMSITCAACTACFLPAFLAFGVDSEGKRDVIPFACEGDLNGVASLAMLHQLEPGVPPLFGDLVAYRSDHVLLRNCGASSVYWAGLSNDPAVSLPQARLRPNLHGASGAAIGYETPACSAVTFARLFRQNGSFAMLLGKGSILGHDAGSEYDDPWPHTRLSLGVDSRELFSAMPCNHGSLSVGDMTAEIEFLCAYAGLRVFRCDDDRDLRALRDSRGDLARQF
jgi:L-fucose isomerase-like protein